MACMEWIIDMGVSRHMTGDMTYLTNIQSIEACSVGLPNGYSTFATMHGEIHLTGHLICVMFYLFLSFSVI